MEIVAKYACFQAAAALEAYRPMRERLEQEQMGRLFDEVEMHASVLRFTIWKERAFL